MYGVEQPRPSFYRAWVMALVVSAPIAWLAERGFHWPLWLVAPLWIGGTLLSAQSIMARMSNDWRAKSTMDMTRNRFNRYR